MGDGRVALILDIEGVAQHGNVRFGTGPETALVETQQKQFHHKYQDVFLFKSGEAEQFAVSLPLIRRIERIALSDIERIGEKEFVTIDGISTRILRLEEPLTVSPCIEKPEMFLLLPKHIKKPFGVLISEVVDIARAPDQLNTESYMEEGLLGSSLIGGRMTLFLELFRLIEKVEPAWFGDPDLRQFNPAGKTQILLAEDDRFFRDLIRKYIEESNYDVIDAENGMEALEMLHRNDFDLIVSDIEMPEMDGFTLMERVRQEHQFNHIPAIALTSLSSEESRNRAMDAGFDSFQLKFDREVLLSEISGLIQTEKNKGEK